MGHHLINEPDNKEGSSEVAKEGQDPVAGDLENIGAALEKGSRQVSSIGRVQLACTYAQMGSGRLPAHMHKWDEAGCLHKLLIHPISASAHVPPIPCH